MTDTKQDSKEWRFAPCPAYDDGSRLDLWHNCSVRISNCYEVENEVQEAKCHKCGKRFPEDLTTQWILLNS